MPPIDATPPPAPAEDITEKLRLANERLLISGLREHEWANATENARLEAETLASQLRLVTQRLEAAQRVAGIGIFDWDVVRQQLYWSPELYGLMGVAPNSVEATPEAWTAALVEEDREIGWGAYREATGARQDAMEVELRLRQPGGGSRWVRLSTKIYYDDEWAPLRLIGAVVDVQALKEAAAEKAAALRDAEQIARAKEEFLLTVSHELRTPLNAVLGWATILKKDFEDRAKLQRGLAVIERNAKAQAHLISDLLDASRLISGKLVLARAPVDVSAVIEAALDVVRPAADAKNVDLTAQLAADLGTVLADPNRLQQIIWNLLDNAVRFTQPRGEVTISAERSDSVLKIVVKDTGVGIAAEHLPHVFDRFRQVDSSTTRKHDGLGLGLAIVRHLAEAHDGTVNAESAGANEGAQFTVVLPAIAGQSLSGAGSATVEALSTYSEPPANLHNIRALVVDDNLDSADLVRQFLEQAGATVHLAKSAREALAASGPWDIIVSDIGMPEVDGFTFLQQIRAQGSGAGVPAIALTAYARVEDARRSHSAGFDAHLAKPIDAAQLLKTVGVCIESRRRSDRAPDG